MVLMNQGGAEMDEKIIKEEKLFVDILGKLVPIVGVHEEEDQIILLPDGETIETIIRGGHGY